MMEYKNYLAEVEVDESVGLLQVVSLKLCKREVRASGEGGQPGKERGSSL